VKIVIVNPAAGGGKTRRAWAKLAPPLRAAIGPFETSFTAGPGGGAVRAQEALRAGATEIIAVGGDGTVSECVDGLFAPGVVRPPELVFGAVSTGTGCDFGRSFDIAPGAAHCIARLATAQPRAVDIGRVTVMRDGGEVTRHFANIASLGLSGAVSAAVNQAVLLKRLSGRLAFLWGSLQTMRRFRAIPVRITLDDRPPIEAGVSLIIVANGRYFGGGMKAAPEADPRDGLFDVVIVRMEAPLRPADIKLMYSGAHTRLPTVTVARARQVNVVPQGGDPLLADVDGETPGRAPARFEIVPAALQLRW
jgi:YegS/Rv2252/BmrU family lipid kinase